MCDGCGFWHHSACEVSDEVFSFLSKHDDEENDGYDDESV